MDPMTMMAMASLGTQAAGQKQLGGIAPPFNPGGSMGMGGLEMLTGQKPNMGGNVFDLLNSLNQDPAPVEPKPEDGPVTSKPSVFNTDEQNAAMQPQNPFSNFFGNLDQSLQSPSKVLGLGLLNQLHPALPYAGLLGMGLLGKRQ